MSSDFLEDIDEDENGSTVLLNMEIGGDAFLTIMGSEDSNDYHFAPNDIGWRNAEKIVAAINEWIEHTKEIFNA